LGKVDVFDHRSVVVPIKEAVHRGENARCDELRVAGGSGVQPDRGQAFCASNEFPGRVAVDEAIDQHASMRGDVAETRAW
jgi:hypothetical protein